MSKYNYNDDDLKNAVEDVISKKLSFIFQLLLLNLISLETKTKGKELYQKIC